jgi:ribonuclease P/MRP protein subunit POP5
LRKVPPSLRHRKRYIAFRLIGLSNSTRDDETAKEIARKLMENILSLFGEMGGIHSGVWVEHWEGECGIVRCYLASLEKVKIAITLIDEIKGVKVLPVILGVSGTIKRCKTKYLEVCKDADTANGL